jgi:hypothetical protein
MKYRKKPVVIEAYQNIASDDTASTPHWLVKAVVDGSIVTRDDGSLLIKTLEGNMVAGIGDWIIQDVKGELHPCKPDIFAATYEEVK